MVLRVYLLRTIKTSGLFLYSFCLLHTFSNHFVSVVTCEGDSMYPTINATPQNDVVLVEHWTKKKKSLSRNDIVIVSQPDSPGDYICKRIIAVEGDDLKRYKRTLLYNKWKKVPSGHVWLEGDNTERSYDSRRFGPVPQGLVHGRVFFRAGFIK
eukprot:Em0003g651a